MSTVIIINSEYYIEDLLSNRLTHPLPLDEWEAIKNYIYKRFSRKFGSDILGKEGLQRLKRYLDNLMVSSYPSKSGVTGKKPLIVLEARSRQGAYKVVETLINRFISKPVKKKFKKNFWTEKTPWNVLFFPEIARLLPSAKLVHIHRNPKDVIDSVSTKNWGPPSIEESIHWYNSWFTRWEDIRNKVVGLSNYFEIPYKEFTTETNIWYDLHNFLGLTKRSRPSLRTVHEGRHKTRWKSKHHELFNKLGLDRRTKRVFGYEF